MPWPWPAADGPRKPALTPRRLVAKSSLRPLLIMPRGEGENNREKRDGRRTCGNECDLAHFIQSFAVGRHVADVSSWPQPPRPHWQRLPPSSFRAPRLACIPAAIRSEEHYLISFWDALILAAAESGGDEVLHTQDLNDGKQYGTVVARDPFRGSEASSSPP